jgi:hypothetical protein
LFIRLIQYFLNFRLSFVFFSYKDVDIKDFTNSWKDGLAFNALIHRYRPQLFNYDEELDVNKRQLGNSRIKFAENNLEHAFNMAREHLQIERLLDIEDVITDYPDKKSIMMYVMCYFQVLSKPFVIIDENKETSEVIMIFKYFFFVDSII